jgi:predicted ester cyclase
MKARQPVSLDRLTASTPSEIALIALLWDHDAAQTSIRHALLNAWRWHLRWTGLSRSVSFQVRAEGGHMSSEENKALVLRWFEETDNGNLEVIDELLSVDYVDHNPPLPGLPAGREGIRQAVLMLRAAFPDAVHTIDSQTAAGDKVMTQLHVRATFRGEIFGIQPTGAVVEISGTAVHRIAAGQLVEHWAQMDLAGFMHQLEQSALTKQPA